MGACGIYDPKDPFKVGWNKGGIDNNKQSDAAGDRGEWDMDNSGNAQLYISHLMVAYTFMEQKMVFGE